MILRIILLGALFLAACGNPVGEQILAPCGSDSDCIDSFCRNGHCAR